MHFNSDATLQKTPLKAVEWLRCMVARFSFVVLHKSNYLMLSINKEYKNSFHADSGLMKGHRGIVNAYFTPLCGVCKAAPLLSFMCVICIPCQKHIMTIFVLHKTRNKDWMWHTRPLWSVSLMGSGSGSGSLLISPNGKIKFLCFLLVLTSHACILNPCFPLKNKPYTFEEVFQRHIWMQNHHPIPRTHSWLAYKKNHLLN